MSRFLAFFAAVLLTAISVSTSCLAGSPDNLRFTLMPSKSAATVQLSFFSASDPRDHSMSTSFATTDLAGLDLQGLRSAGLKPLRFALVRDAGRLDCSGSGGNSSASGSCSFTPDLAFGDYLAKRGIGRPSREEAFHLTMVGAGRRLVETLSNARYPAPTLDNLTALAALEVSPAFISDLASRGYRPNTLDELVEFAALDITPAYIDAMARSGYRGLTADAIVQFKAVGVTPEFIAGFERIGYRNLPASKLVEMKALGVTPEYVASLQRSGITPPSADQLLKLRAIGFVPNAADRR